MLTNDDMQEAQRIAAEERSAYRDNVLPIAASARWRKPRCPECGEICKPAGRDKHGHQRWRCRPCNRVPRGLGRLMNGAFLVPDLKIQIIIHILAEGIGIRGAARVVGVHRDTVQKINRLAGQWCGRFLSERVIGIPASEVEVDEVWTYVFKKQFKVRDLEKKNHKVGSVWFYVGIDRKTRLILTSHLGRRSIDDACEFMRKLRSVTSGQMTVYTDGFQAYPTAVYAAFLYEGKLEALPDFIDNPMTIVRNNGDIGPLHSGDSVEYSASCTNHIERFNATLRSGLKRMARRTHAFSKSYAELQNSLYLFIAYYNFCKPHGALAGKTPAMVAGLTDHPWTIRDLLLAIQPEGKVADIAVEAQPAAMEVAV